VPPVLGPTIYLVGFMCSGKTTVGRLLAQQLQRTFIDLDDRVAAAAGCSIPDLFERDGEAVFRTHERAALRAVAGSSAVVATGGGTMAEPANRELMLGTGRTLWLRVPFAVTLGRQSGCLGTDDARPLWRDDDRMAALYRHRERSYRLAHDSIDATDPPHDLALALAQRVLELELTP
jgi:shikimate kinase